MPCFSKDVSQLSKLDYPLAHYARMFGLAACVAVCLQEGSGRQPAEGAREVRQDGRRRHAQAEEVDGAMEAAAKPRRSADSRSGATAGADARFYIQLGCSSRQGHGNL